MQGFRVGLGGAQKGDIDEVTASKAIEVKGGNLHNEVADAASISEFVAQLRKLKTFASSNGKTPSLGIRTGEQIPEAMQGVLDAMEGIVVIRY